MHFWKALSGDGVRVTYGDVVPDESIDVLWTNRDDVWKPTVARMAYFASIGHYSYVTKQVRAVSKYATSQPAQGLCSFAERWKHWLTLSRSMLVMVIGNRRIKASFEPALYGQEILLINCGIDTDHFKVDLSQMRQPLFVHNATRFSVRKGSHVVAQAWRRVVGELGGAKLVLLGRPGDFSIAASLNDVPNVEYRGEYIGGSREYIETIGTARWVVLPSVAEGQAGTLLEAMSCGCVPIASRDTGVDAEQYGGYVIEPNDSETLAAMLRRAYAEWNVKQPEHTRETVVARHGWPDFERHIREATNTILERPPTRSTRPSGILLRLLTHFAKHHLSMNR